MKQLRIQRQFNVKPEQVFKAFTNPDDMIVWWTHDTVFDIDLQVGGKYTISRRDGENTFVMTGKYLEVDPPNKLVYTLAMPDFSPVTDTITIEIQPDGKGGSQMTFTQVGNGIDEELQQLAEGEVSESEKGWAYGFDLMMENWKKRKKNKAE